MLDYKVYLDRLVSGKAVENPYLDFMGIRAEEFRAGYARFSMEIKPEFIQGAGIMQGGLSVSLCDETSAHAAITTLSNDEQVATIEIKNDFLSMASKGILTAEATVFKRGRTLIVVDCVVTDENSKKISRSTATFMVIKNKK
jgi:acyl-CoA thioesterase